MNISELPPHIDGLYDKIEFDAYDYYSFKLNGKEVVSTYSEDITSLTIKHPKAHYKDVYIGMPVTDVLDTDAQLYASGNIESSEFSAWFELDGVQLGFNHYNSKGFSNAGHNKLFKSTTYDCRLLTFSKSDFQPSATIDDIYISK